MKKFIFLISILVLTSINIKAQVTEWAEKIAGTGTDDGGSVAVDSSGNVYVVGRFLSSTLSLNNSKSITSSGNYDIFLAKYNSTGLCQWAEKIAGTSSESGYGIAVDRNGYIYLTGFFMSLNLTFNNGKTLSGGGTYSDAFISKYNSAGICQWAEKIAGTYRERGRGIALDSIGNVFVVGEFQSTTTTFNNSITLNHSGSLMSCYLAKYNNSGICQWATKISTVNNNSVYVSKIVVDNSNNVYITGDYENQTATFNNGISLSNSGGYDAFISKYNSNGVCQWATKIAGTSQEMCGGIALDSSWNIYVIGDFKSTTLTLNNGITLSSNGVNDVYIAKYNSSGICQWAEKIGGSGWDFGNGIAIDGNSNFYVTG